MRLIWAFASIHSYTHPWKNFFSLPSVQSFYVNSNYSFNIVVSHWLTFDVENLFNLQIEIQITNQYDKHTGILDVLKNSNNASREPSVDAWTYTPSELNFIWLSADRSSLATSSLKRVTIHFNVVTSCEYERTIFKSKFIDRTTSHQIGSKY